MQSSRSELPLISSRRNPLVRRLRSLGTRQGRLEQGNLLLEGTHLLQELLGVVSGPFDLIASELWLDRHRGQYARQCPRCFLRDLKQSFKMPLTYVSSCLPKKEIALKVRMDQFRSGT